MEPFWIYGQQNPQDVSIGYTASEYNVKLAYITYGHRKSYSELFTWH
uniref:Uncharacterized protein n=1 Tax=Anguilla anguilla TaxID=7936 RepID=A0A0E9VPT7_ANGAN